MQVIKRGVQVRKRAFKGKLSFPVCTGEPDWFVQVGGVYQEVCAEVSWVCLRR